MALFRSRTTFKLPYLAASTLRKIFLIYDNKLHKAKETKFSDRSSIIPSTFLGVRIAIYNGRFWQQRTINRWMIGYKFGEFTWNRKIALYKAKQLRKKQKKKK